MLCTIGTSIRPREREAENISSRGLDGRAGAQLIRKKDYPVFQTSAVFIRHGEDLPVQVLEDQADHKILGLVLPPEVR